MTVSETDFAPLVESIYDIVVAPDRLDELVDAWTQALHAGAPELAAHGLLAQPKLFAHVERVEPVLQGYVVGTTPVTEGWTDRVGSAAFVADRAGNILSANSAARLAFDLSFGDHVSALGLTTDDEAALSRLLGLGASAAHARDLCVMRLARVGDPLPMMARLIFSLQGNAEQIGVITSVVRWPRRIGDALRTTFGTTEAEVEVLRDLVMGQSVKEIATNTGRAEATLRSHVRALLDKTGTRSLTELIRMSLGLIEMLAPDDAGYDAGGPVFTSSEGNVYHTLLLPDGRTLDYLIIGAPAGAPFLLLPSNVGTTRLPARHEDDLVRRDLTMIVPVRAGYGRSSPPPRGRHIHEVATADTRALLDHLSIARLPVLSFADDFRIALELAALMPERFKALLACGAPMPSSRPEHYQRMTKMTRFVAMNARYAPSVVHYLALIFYGIAKRTGKKRFFQIIMGESKADQRALEHAPTLDALMRGSEIAFSSAHMAHRVVAAETLANFSGDWTQTLGDCKTPITLFAGHDDPFSPFATVREICQEMPQLKLVEFPDCGQLLFPHFDVVLDAVEAAAKG
jgi:pimeloyl-ACP methyl ester carboxylesterase/DNA-binding CsgD family transcriptional regulator